MCFDKTLMATGTRPVTPGGSGRADIGYPSHRGEEEAFAQPDQRVQRPRATRTVPSDRGGRIRAIEDLYRYVWKISGRDQVILSVLSVTLFLLELAPLELQRRIVNSAVDRQAFEVIGLLCLLYTQRRINQILPALSVLEIEQVMFIPREHLQFTIWYLKSKRYIAQDDRSSLMITAEGIDYLEVNLPEHTTIRKLLKAAETGASRTAGGKVFETGWADVVETGKT